MKGFTEQHLKDYLARHAADPRITEALAREAPSTPRKQGRKGQRPVPEVGSPPRTLLLYACVPIEPVSVNELYANVPGGRVLTAKGRTFKTEFRDALIRSNPYMPRQIVEQPLRLTLHFAGNWETKDGQPRKRDVGNAEKSLSDVLAAFLGVDDRWFYEIHATKRHADTPALTIHVHALQYRKWRENER